MHEQRVNLAEELDLLTVFRAVWRRRYVVAGIVVVSMMGAAVIALLETPIFRAQVVVIRRDENNLGGAASLVNQFGGLASLVGLNLGSRGTDQEAEGMLASRWLAEQFVARYSSPDEILPPSGKPRTLWLAVKHFKESVLSIDVNRVEGTTAVAIDWKDPKVAAEWANGYVALANELLRTRAIDESKRNIEYLNEQIKSTNVVELQTAMYELTKSEMQRLMLANGRTTDYAFAVVDPAVAPEIRRSPKRTLMVLYGMLIGLFLGMVVVLSYDAAQELKARGA